MSTSDSQSQSQPEEGGQVWIGNLPRGVKVGEIHHLLLGYGLINFVDMNTWNRMGRRGPPYVIVELADPRDAVDAIAELNGMLFKGRNIRVEAPRGERREEGEEPSQGTGQKQQRSKFRVLVTELPLSVTWKDLKDHMRSVGDPGFVKVYANGRGMVEFSNRQSVLDATFHLNGSVIRSHKGDWAHISVTEDYGLGFNKRPDSRSRSRSRSRSPIAWKEESSSAPRETDGGPTVQNEGGAPGQRPPPIFDYGYGCMTPVVDRVKQGKGGK